MRRTAGALAAVCAVLLAAQGGPPPATKKAAPKAAPKKKKQAPAKAASGPKLSPEDAAAERWLQSLNMRQRIAQLVVIRTHGNIANIRGAEWRNIVRWVRDTQVGGIIVVNRVRRGAVVKAQPYETLAFINRLQRLAKVPLLVGGDFERGVSMRFDGTVAYPHAMAYAAAGKPEWTAELGRLTAREARALGFQWVFAPDADVNSNPENPIIGIRAFGTDPATVSEHVLAFLNGAEMALPKVLVTVKHFPGHGDTETDSHLGMPVVQADRARLEKVELAPFRAAIAGGADSVMTAHISLPKVDESGVPATISPVVIGDLLRKQLGFGGIVTTDAMDMDGLAAAYGSAESSVRALMAGVDVLLMPRNPDQAIDAVVKALTAKRLTAEQINESVRKVLRAKVRLGLTKTRITDPDGVAEVAEDDVALAHAQQVADGAVAVLRGDRSKLPLANNAGSCVIALADRRGNGQGDRVAEDLRARAPLVKVLLLDPQMPEEALAAAGGGCERIAVAAFLGFGGTGKLNPVYGPLLERLIGGGKPVILAAVGNPYLARPYLGAALVVATFSTVPVSEAALVKVLLGELKPLGKAFVN